MKKQLSAQAISHYIEWLSFDHIKSTNLSEKDSILLDKLYEILNQIKPTGKDNCHELWLYALNNRNNKVWFSLCTTEYQKSRAVFLGGKFIIGINPHLEKDWQSEITDLLEWMISAVNEAIEMLKQGTYNSFVEENLPYKYRQGAISRKKYYELFPEENEDDEDKLTKEEIDDFVNYVNQFRLSEDGNIISDFVLPAMTSGKYFEICSYGYSENKMKYYDKWPPIEMYKRYADDRDGGLTKINPDSESDFLNWFSKSDDEKWKEDENPSHTWEVIEGGSRTRMHLYLEKTDRGWSLELAGSRSYCTVESVRFYLGLVHHGIFPTFYGVKELLAKIKEEDKLGVVGYEGSTFAYAYGGFPDPDIVNFIYMPEKKQKTFIKNTIWYELQKIELQN